MRRWARPVLILALLVAGVAGTRALGLGDLIRLENVARLKQWIEGFGALAPVVFIAGYVLAVVFFVPGLPITVLGGVAFGPVWGTLYVWIAATIGAALAFLVARYAVRSTVERWVRASPRLSRLDELAAEHGWRIVMLTRLVPLFPFNLQNYAYGLTRIGFWPYAITSSICMLPGTAAYTFAGGALSEGRGDVRRTLGYLAVAGVLLVLVSLIPRWLQRRSRVAGDLLRAGVMAVLLDAFVLAASASAATAGEEACARLSDHEHPRRRELWHRVPEGPAFESPVLTNNGGGEHDGKRFEHDEECLDPWPAGSDLLRGGGDRRSGGGPFQPRAVSVGA